MQIILTLKELEDQKRAVLNLFISRVFQDVYPHKDDDEQFILKCVHPDNVWTIEQGTHLVRDDQLKELVNEFVTIPIPY